MPDFNDSHPREREVYLDAAEIDDPTELSAFLDEECQGDKHLRARVETLLGVEERPDLMQTEPLIRPVIAEVKSDGEFRFGSASGASSRAWKPPKPEILDPLFEAYKIEKLIGRGGMGAVYRGIQTSLERSVAIKILSPEFNEDPSFSERFRREALAMGTLEHPNIVTIYDFGKAGDFHFIAMEFVEGADLHKLISTGDLKAEEALRVVSQICDALQYAHNCGYVHRDIKPANIFVTTEGQVKVGDFGLAKLASDDGDHVHQSQLTMSGYLIGTPNYMAPETMSNEQIDHRADIYSLGVMFYEMLTGSVPKGVFDPPSKKVEIDIRLDEVVLKAMHEEPERRYQQASEVKTEVEEISKAKRKLKPKASGTRVWKKAIMWAGAVAVIGGLAVMGITGLNVPELGDGKIVSKKTLVKVGKDEPIKLLTIEKSERPSMIMVDGCPAISFYHKKEGTLKFVIADDPEGQHWSEPLTVDAQNGTGIFSALAIVDGCPAIAYRDAKNQSLKFVIAKDLRGTNWGTPVLVDNEGGTFCKMAVVNGRPVIVHRSMVSQRLKYAESSKPDGTGAWSARVIESETPVGYSCDLAVVDGRPAISYCSMISNLWYAIADDMSADKWNFQQVEASGTGVSMVIINDRPAILCGGQNAGLKYLIADDSSGTNWTIQTIDSSGNYAGRNATIAATEGRVAIAYSTAPSGLFYGVANELSGENWTVSQVNKAVPSQGHSRPWPSMIIGNKRSIICYHDASTKDIHVVQMGAKTAEQQSKIQLPSLDLPDVSKLPKGKVHIWDSSGRLDFVTDDVAEIEDFVEVQVRTNIGWQGLRSNGDVVICGIENGIQGGRIVVEEIVGKNVCSLRRTSSPFNGALLTRNGRLITRRNGTTYDSGFSIPPGQISDFAIPNIQEHRSALLMKEGTIVGAKSNDFPAPTGKTDIVQIGNWNRHAIGIRSSGEVVIWAADPKQLDDLRAHKIAKLHSTPSHSIALTIDGEILHTGMGLGTGVEKASQGKLGLYDVSDVVCARGVFAARRGDGKWIAWGDNRFGLVDIINSLATKVISLSFSPKRLVWVEESSPPSLKLSTRDLPDVSKLPKGNIHAWGFAFDHSQKEYPMEVGDAETMDDFVEVQLKGANGWYGLRSNGDVVKWEPEIGTSAYKEGLNVATLNRTSEINGGNWLSRDGGAIIKGHPEPNLTTRAPASGMTDMARAYPSRKWSILKSNGQVEFLGTTEFPPPAGINDFIRINHVKDRHIGIRESGELVSWNLDPSTFPNLSNYRFKKIRSSEFETLLLTTDGKIVHLLENQKTTLPKEIADGPWSDISCALGVQAARRADTGHWRAWGMDKASKVIEKINTLGPNVSSLSTSEWGVVWIETE